MMKDTLRVYDSGNKYADRYTVVNMNRPEYPPGCYECFGMSTHPFHPQGIGQHGSAMPGGHLGMRIRFSDLNTDCQRAAEHMKD